MDIGLAQLDAGLSEVKLKMDKLQTTVMLSLFPTLLNNDQPQAAIQAKRGSQEITNIPPSQATVENKEQALLAHSSGR